MYFADDSWLVTFYIRNENNSLEDPLGERLPGGDVRAPTAQSCDGFHLAAISSMTLATTLVQVNIYIN